MLLSRYLKTYLLIFYLLIASSFNVQASFDGKLFLNKYNLTMFDLASGARGDFTKLDVTPCQKQNPKTNKGGFGNRKKSMVNIKADTPNVRTENQ